MPQGSKRIPPPSAADYLLPVEPGTGAAILTGTLPRRLVRENSALFLRLTPYDQRFLSRIGVKFRP